MREVARYYQILEVPPSATTEDINQSYQDLAWIWQPDRFEGNPRLQSIAQHKLQEINEAHHQLMAINTPPSSSNSPPPSAQAYYPAYLPHYGRNTCVPPRSQHWQGSFEAVNQEYRGDNQRVKQRKEVSTWLD